MPGYNRMGPSGRGPMTGRGQGLCRAGRASTGADSQAGIGWGRGFRCGHGWGHGNFAGRRLGQPEGALMGTQTESMHSEIDRLKAQAQSMQQALDETNRYIAEMEKPND